MLDTDNSGELPKNRYPQTLTLIRHAESQYNSLKKQIVTWEIAQKFKKQFNKEYYGEHGLPKEDLDLEVLEGHWPSPALKEISLKYYKEIRKVMKGISDFDTPITEEGLRQATETGTHIAEKVPTPDVIYLSPYVRTRQTLEAILAGAPDDWKSVPRWDNKRLREQEHGMQTVFNDWRLNFVFEPFEMLHNMKQGSYSYRYKGGENKFDVHDRASRFIGRIRNEHEGKNVLVVSHHLTILATLGELLHWTREEFMEWDENRRPDNTSITIFRREEGASRTKKDLLRLDPTEYSMKLYTPKSE